MLSKEELDKFRELYKNRFGKDLSGKEVYEQANKLLQLMKLVYRPMTEQEYKDVGKRRETT